MNRYTGDFSDFDEWVESEVRKRMKIALDEKNIETVIENEARSRAVRYAVAEVERRMKRITPFVACLMLIILILATILLKDFLT